MESSIIIALITAITSITVAIIQSTVSLRVAASKEPSTRNNIAPKQTATATNKLSPGRMWLWIGIILIISNIVILFILGTYLSFTYHFGAVLWCTCLLAYFQPIRWAYVAGIVALINIIWMVASFIEIGQWRTEDLVLASTLYLVNTILATGIAYVRRNA